ncbi:MAG: hypothetical protein PWP49_1318 [Thermococcaceae archaeon]|jgi:hypothetical protein|uniref:hypothetical protein n=1 Tax=unclassified Thermococcus TaxID=2627626 RepID=UPI0005B2D58F|nr:MULTISPECIES: hypothetical protein [unclassified Thermococcus]KUJ98603.1 MAG: Uncharacterized protein XD43_1734 [Thermococcales archaeon 44_46]MDK2853842.1 hypothetical protein [Thermococcaceae archaeon]MDK2984311.1 hypothetical protein [Thermococcaceae archaeon]MDN5320898.1 hypothetical protein [Thermococcaceae archaeon]MPW38548.1 hypothetical protein [Thermococcus sp. 101 C5]
MKVTPEMLFLIMVLGAAATLQFYKGRKLNLGIMDYYLRTIEKVVKPKDKNYVWLGGYVGFRAFYKVNEGNIDKFEYTLTLLPRQSIFYFPISKLINRHDKIYFVIKPYATIKREAHLIQKGYYRFRPNIEDEELLQREIVEVNGIQYEALFEKKRDVELLKEFLQGFSKVENVKHVSLTPKTNVLYVFMKPEIDTIEQDVRHIVRFVNESIKENPFER